MAQRSARRKIELRLVVDREHIREVVEQGLLTAQISIWISSANVKDVHIESPIGTVARARGRYQSLFAWLKSQSDLGIDVRLLHAAAPSRILAANQAWKQGHRIHRACPRVHLKMIAVDGRLLYLGSANFTGAGFGSKSEGNRNFEAGIVTDDPLMLDELQRMFDDIWTGKRCGNCRLRAQCPAPLDGMPSNSVVSQGHSKTPDMAGAAVRSKPCPRRPNTNGVTRVDTSRAPSASASARKKSRRKTGRA